SVDLAADTPIESTVGERGLDDVNLTVEPHGSYQGVAFQPDEYRCFIYDPGFAEDTWLSGYEFVPDQTEVVHHAIGYRISGDRLAAAQALDARHDDQGGWPCFGSSGLGQDEIFLGWAPGQGPTELPQRSGMRLAADDFMVIQIHYHFEVDVPADRSTMELDIIDDPTGFDEVRVVEFLAPAEIPCSTDESGPLCDRDAAMSAAVDKYGSEGVLADQTLLFCRRQVADFAHMTGGVASSSCDLPARQSGTIVSVLGHEHELGRSFKMTLNPGTEDELVLLDIPEWDFDWQLNYYPVDDIEISASDIIRTECSWDRSLRDPGLEPAYILWADGTNDEMCFATIVVREN
ncbi:MAG: hypothetical protein P8N02_19525, partial [Actinomycetota bacterium]|nr:hypothetical protein [Actinomycetota bacterium]